MMLTGFLFLLLLTGGRTSSSLDLLNDQLQSNQSFEEGGSTLYEDTTVGPVDGLRQEDMDGGWQPPKPSGCIHRDVLKYVKWQLQDYVMTRPGGDESPTEVKLDVLLYAILDVKEKDQKFESYLWVDMVWYEHDIHWDPAIFCGISKLYLPTSDLWKPDLTIEEMTEKDKAVQSPYLTVINNGVVIQRNDMMVISTCKMEVYKFPFDIQTCTLSFKSAVYSDEHLKLVQAANSSWNFDWSHAMMTQSEWLFINMTINSITVDNFGFNQSKLVYTIKMRRRSSLLYVANFILPIMFFLCLDLASFLISDSGGEKLSFKVTVLLAVTVMQLILNEILPSSSDRIPLIVSYCIGIFGLMMISLLETILVMYLMEKDSQDNQVDEDQSLVHKGNRGVKKWTPCGAFVCDVSADETPSTKEVNSSQLTEKSSGLEKVSGELREVEKTLTEFNNRNEEKKPGYWTRATKTINRVFFVCYVTAATLFLVVIFSMWNSAADE